ncbi:YopX family protein, partial [Streptococcus minor]|uniref:YopX family protein n=1 Tax=Streptococcus minor TaxID=229549 RepID=UPI000360EAE7
KMIQRYRAFYEGKMYGVKAVIWTSRGLYVTLDEGNKAGRRVRGAALMQSTGLFDVNGKEIFEGDVVRVTCEHPIDFPDCQGVVRMLEGRYMVCDDKTERGSELFSEIFSNEIIGNIYENPEFLEEVE